MYQLFLPYFSLLDTVLSFSEFIYVAIELQNLDVAPSFLFVEVLSECFTFATHSSNAWKTYSNHVHIGHPKHYSSKITLSLHTTRRHKTTEPRSLWLKLGYHPALPKVASLALKLKAPGNLKVRACWKNRLPSLMARIGGRNKPLIHSHGNGCLLGLAGGRCVSA